MSKMRTMGKDRNTQSYIRKAQRAAENMLGSMVAPLGWTKMQQEPGEWDGIKGIFTNDRCEVSLTITGPQEEYMHLSIVEKNRSLSWRELNQVKIDILGAECEAVELYPSVLRELKSERKRHLWCLLPGMEFPFGLVPPEVMEQRKYQQEVLQAMYKFMEDKVVQLIPSTTAGQSAYVYRDVDDALACGADGKLMSVSLARLPEEDTEGVVWSAAARAYREEIMAALQGIAEAMDRERSEKQAETMAEVISLDSAELADTEAKDAEAALELAAMRAEMVRNLN